MGVLDLPPGSAILSWPPANYDTPDTRGGSSIIGCLILTAACFFVFCMRLSARALKSKSLGVDDYIMMFAMLPTLGLVANAYLAITMYDFDRHLWDVKASNFPAMLKVTFADEFLYTVAAGFIKLSILTFFLRYTHLTTPYKYVIWAMIGTVVCHMMIFIEELFLNCIPFEANFVVVAANEPRQCVAGGTWASVRNMIGIIQAFVITFTALAMFWNIKVSQFRQKMAVFGTLAFAVVVCFVGVTRYGYFHQIYFTATDWSWIGGKAFMWSAFECVLGVICASLPALDVYAFNTPIFIPVMDVGSNTHKEGSFKESGWRKFSMNESGLRSKNMLSNEAESLHSSTHTGRNQAPYGGGRRRSRVPSMAHIIMEKE